MKPPMGVSLGAVILTLVAGCAGVLPGPPPAPPMTYLLAPDLAIGHSRSEGKVRQPRFQASGLSLQISKPEAAAGYASKRMAYMEQDYRLDYFADHAWVAQPATMLELLLVRGLRGSGAFAAVREDGRGIRTDLRLDTTIEAIYQDFRVSPSRSVVAVRVQLVDPVQGRILATRVFEDQAPASSDDPYGGVVAANAILARMLPGIVAFVAEASAQWANGSTRSVPNP